MNKTNQIVLGIVLVIAIAGSYLFPASTVRTIVQEIASASPAGSTFLNAKFAGIVVSLASAGANGTSTSILNSDSNDRLVTGFRVGCENVGSSKTAYTGAGLANLQVSIGTTTSAAPASFLTAAAVASSFNLSTTTVNLLAGSSTLQTATSSLAGVWPTNTYMTFFFNATNTAACTVGVDYIGS